MSLALREVQRRPSASAVGQAKTGSIDAVDSWFESKSGSWVTDGTTQMPPDFCNIYELQSCGPMMYQSVADSAIDVYLDATEGAVLSRGLAASRYGTSTPVVPVTNLPVPVLRYELASIASWEAEQQADLIANSYHVDAALNALVEGEGLTVYDLSRALNISRQSITAWRKKPLERRREAKSRRFWNLIFAWKLWVRLQPEVRLGEILRRESNGYSLLELIQDEHTERVKLQELLFSLVPGAKNQTQMHNRWRQNAAGLPDQSVVI